MASTAGAASWLDAKKDVVKALDEYGLNLGLAFQIADDILDITSSTEELGKTVGSDASLNKVTYPSLLGLEEAQKRALKHADKAVSALEIFGESKWKRVLCELADYVVRRKK